MVSGSRRRAVLALLAAEIVSTTGAEITAVALPWFVLVTTGSPARMGSVLAAEFLGMAVLGIPSGRLATALGPRRTMLVADAACAPIVALIPALHWAGLLSFPVIIAAAFVVGAFFPAYTSSQSLVLAALVEEDEGRFVRTGALLGSVNETASFIGPAIGGLLVAFLGAAPVLLIDSATYLASFALLGSFVPAVAGERPAPSERSVRAGLRYLRSNKQLARTVAGLAVIELAFTALIASLPVLTRRRYHATAQLAGWLLASYGAGSVAGGLLTTRARSIDGRIARLALAGLAVTTWPLLLTLPRYGVALAIAANGVCSGLYFSRFFASVTLRTPPELRARVSAAVNTLISSTGPIGFVAAGLLLQHASLRATYALVVVAATLGAAIALSTRTS